MFVCGWGTGAWRVVPRYAYDITEQPVAAPLGRMVDADDAPVASTRAETHTEQADDQTDKASRTKAKADRVDESDKQPIETSRRVELAHVPRAAKVF